MLKVASYNVSPVNNSRQTFRANLNTRQILESLDCDDYFEQGHAKIQKMVKWKKACKESFKKRVGEYLVYRGCKRKQRYDTEYMASRVARTLSKKISGALDYYECPLCDGWHVCKAVNKIKRAILF